MTICELRILVDLHSDCKAQFLDKLFLDKDIVISKCNAGYFFVDSCDGRCYLFDKSGNEDDISKVKSIDEDMIPKDIEKINIPNHVTSIENYAFWNCSKLTSVTIPDSVTSIGRSAFRFCSKLTSITIPNNVTSIGNFVFYDCSRLINVTIPNSVTSIGNRAFLNCNNLKSITFKGKTIEEVQSMENYPFGVEYESIIRCI